MAADPAHGADGVLDVLVDLDTVLDAEMVVGTGTDQTSLGEVFSLRLELVRRATCPASTKKKQLPALIGWLPVRRVVEVERQLPFAEVL